MSVEAITWAIGQQLKPSSAKFVLVALSNCADGREFIAWPSVKYLVEATNQDRKTVLANLALLRERGFIEDTGERRGSTKQVVVYRLKTAAHGPLDKEAQKRDSPENGTVPLLGGKSAEIPNKEAHNSQERGPKMGHGTVSNHNGTVRETPEADTGAPSTPKNVKPNVSSGVVTVEQMHAEGVCKQVAEDWLKVRMAKGQPLTLTAWDGIKAEVGKAGISLDDAVRFSAENSWAGFKAIWYKKNRAEAECPSNTLDELVFLKSWSGIVEKGARLGLTQEPGETPPNFKARVLRAVHLTPEQISRVRALNGRNADVPSRFYLRDPRFSS